MIGRRGRVVAAALWTMAVGALAGCDAEPPTAAGTAAPTPAGAASSSIPTPPAAADAPAPQAAGFDDGDIKPPAVYLAEPPFAAADAARGQLLSLACAACHSFAAGGGTLVGPNLHGVFGRRAASLAEYPAYSPALRATELVWTPRALDAWLADPARFVVGTTMTFTGYRSAADRRDLIAYLLSATE